MADEHRSKSKSKSEGKDADPKIPREGLVDSNLLHELEKLAPKGEVRSFVGDICILYLKQSSACIMELAKAVKQGDLAVVAACSFRFRGINASVGATFLVELCREMEKSVSRSDQDMIGVIFELIKDAHIETRDYILAYSSQLPR